jgi:hypothetical protein
MGGMRQAPTLDVVSLHRASPRPKIFRLGYPFTPSQFLGLAIAQPADKQIATRRAGGAHESVPSLVTLRRFCLFRPADVVSLPYGSSFGIFLA